MSAQKTILVPITLSIVVHYDPEPDPEYRARRPFTAEQKRILEQWFFEHSYDPYPNEIEKRDLVSQTGLTKDQISTWFTNTRRRKLPDFNINEFIQ